MKPEARSDELVECPTCHAAIEQDAYWCRHCATRLVSDPTAAPTAPPTLPWAETPVAPAGDAPSPLSVTAPAWAAPAQPARPHPLRRHAANPSNATTFWVALVLVLALGAIGVGIALGTADQGPASAATQHFVASDNSFSAQVPFAGTESTTTPELIWPEPDLALVHVVGGVTRGRLYAITWFDLGQSNEAGADHFAHRLEYLRTRGDGGRVDDQTIVVGTGLAHHYSYVRTQENEGYEEVMIADGDRVYLIDTNAVTVAGLDDFKNLISSIHLQHGP